MKEMYSKAEDCYELSNYLYRKLRNKIRFVVNTYQEVVIGVFYSSGKNWLNNTDGLIFSYKFSKDEFLRIEIGSYKYNKNSDGEKLAALSDFYEILSERYGKPTLFYTIKDDEEGTLSLQWNFIDKEETIQSFKDDTCFDDASVDKLIVFGEEKPNSNNFGFGLNSKTKEFISKQVGVPFELIDLVSENIEDYTYYKTGSEIKVPDDSKIEGRKVVSYEKKLRK